MSALENLQFFGRVYGLAPATSGDGAGEILDRLGLGRDHQRAMVKELSRGQQQKIAVARAFLTSPVLMLLDEPTTGLDPRSKRDVQAFVREVQRDHDATIFLTTHDMARGRGAVRPHRVPRRRADRGRGNAARAADRWSPTVGRSTTSTWRTSSWSLTGRSVEDDEDEEEVRIDG